MDVSESDFVRSVVQHFAFLEKEFGYQRGDSESDNEGITVPYSSPEVRVEIRYEGEGNVYRGAAVYVFLVPLEQGRIPSRFDAQLHERLTTFELERLVRLSDESWSRPPKAEAIHDERDLNEVLGEYARAMRAHAEPALRGDRVIFDLDASGTRRDLIGIHVDEWARFVNQVRCGFEGTIIDYVRGINQRGQLQTFLDRWSGDRSADPRDHIRTLDEEFFEHTDPTEWKFGSEWMLLPSPTARLWWRRPKVLTGTLRQYFEERG